MTAAASPPPAPSTATDPNWAEPANTSADIARVASAPMTGSASTPNEIASAPTATANGIPARIPALSESRRMSWHSRPEP